MSQRLSPRYLEDFRLLPRAAADRHLALGSAVSPLGGFAQALRNPRATGSLRVGEDHPSIQSNFSRCSHRCGAGKQRLTHATQWRAAERIVSLVFDARFGEREAHRNTTGGYDA